MSETCPDEACQCDLHCAHIAMTFQNPPNPLQPGFDYVDHAHGSGDGDQRLILVLIVRPGKVEKVVLYRGRTRCIGVSSQFLISSTASRGGFTAFDRTYVFYIEFPKEIEFCVCRRPSENQLEDPRNPKSCCNISTVLLPTTRVMTACIFWRVAQPRPGTRSDYLSKTRPDSPSVPRIRQTCQPTHPPSSETRLSALPSIPHLAAVHPDRPTSHRHLHLHPYRYPGWSGETSA